MPLCPNCDDSKLRKEFVEIADILPGVFINIIFRCPECNKTYQYETEFEDRLLKEVGQAK